MLVAYAYPGAGKWARSLKGICLSRLIAVRLRHFAGRLPDITPIRGPDFKFRASSQPLRSDREAWLYVLVPRCRRCADAIAGQEIPSRTSLWALGRNIGVIGVRLQCSKSIFGNCDAISQTCAAKFNRVFSAAAWPTTDRVHETAPNPGKAGPAGAGPGSAPPCTLR